MKKIISLALIFAMGLLLGVPAEASPVSVSFPAPSVSAQSAILMNPENGDVYFEKNADEPLGMASTTKLMTALVIAEEMDPERVISVSEEAIGTEGSSIYLIKGEQLTVHELLCALLLSSANDAATALAIAHSGSVENFAARMNERAASMGLKSTHFENPHGLYHEEHYTTARELSLIGAEVLKHPLLKEIVSTVKMTISHDGIPDRRLLVNHNKLLRTYEGAIGLKTGFTKRTGRTLVSAAERDGMTLIAVTLNAPDDWRDHTALLDYGFGCYEKVILAPAGTFCYRLPITGGRQEAVTMTNEKELSLILPKTRSSPCYRVEAIGRFWYAPLQAGQTFGTVTVTCEGKRVSSLLVSVESAEPVTPPKRGLLERLLSFFHT